MQEIKRNVFGFLNDEADGIYVYQQHYSTGN
jgi:hypothetical protein